MDLEKVSSSNSPLVDLSTLQTARLFTKKEEFALEAYSRSEIFIAAPKTEFIQKKWRLTMQKRGGVALLSVKGNDRSPQCAGAIKTFGSYKLWVEDFDAKSQTATAVHNMLGKMIVR